MSWKIACFCGHVIDTSTCPHCGSTLPDFSVRPALRPVDATSPVATLVRDRISSLPRREAA